MFNVGNGNAIMVIVVGREDGVDASLQGDDLVHGLDRGSHMASTGRQGVGQVGLLLQEHVVLGGIADHQRLCGDMQEGDGSGRMTMGLDDLKQSRIFPGFVLAQEKHL